MILSASRRTDIPAFYSEWFMNRIRAGYVYIRNPYHYKQVSKVELRQNQVDCIVFWTKNPIPLMAKLDELDSKGYPYYFQFTLNPYGRDIEADLPDKEKLIDAFTALSEKIGRHKVILRYDPIVITDQYTEAFHISAFERLCSKLGKYTDKIVFSFMDDYRKIAGNMKGIPVRKPTEDQMRELSKAMAEIAGCYGLSLETCAEKIELSDLGIKHARCIDGALIQKILGCEIRQKDKLDGNREFCGCMKSIDIGQYDTCIHNCSYCYANVSKDKALSNYRAHAADSPILFGSYQVDEIKERKDVKSLRVASSEQLSLFDEK